jgi:Flp pilus assembly pilin Flp
VSSSPSDPQEWEDTVVELLASAMVTTRPFVSFKFLSGEEGQTLAEYGLILFLIAVVSVLALTFLGSSIRDNMYYIINDAFGAL